MTDSEILTPNNTLNWLEFIVKLDIHPEITSKVKRFTDGKRHGTRKVISQKIYRNYCE